MTNNIRSTYEAAREELFSSLTTLDLYQDGEHKPQHFVSSDWVEIEQSPGVYMKNINLHKPDNFVISLVHGTKGAFGYKHTVFDDMEIHCVTGRLVINGLEFKSRDRINLPCGTEYNFEYLEDSYLTVKFTPKNKYNFQIYGPSITVEIDYDNNTK